MDAVQQFNFHLLAGDVHKFRLFHPPDEGPFELVEVSGHVRVLQEICHGDDARNSQHMARQIEVDAKNLTAIISRTFFGRVIAVNEVR